MAHLAFYNSTLPSSVTSTILFKMKYPGETIIDIAGLDQTAISALIAALVAATYDEIFVFTPVAETHAAGNFIDQQIADLFPYMTTAGKGTVVTADTATAGDNATITLNTGASTVTGTYVDMIISITGGTGVGEVGRIKTYVGSTLVATKYTPNWTAAPLDNTSEYEIYSPAIREYYDLTVANYDGVYQAWNNMFSGIVPPQVIQYVMRDVTAGNPAGTRWAYAKGTATAGAATTITHTGAFVASAHIGQYVYIASGTGAGQYRKILSNTANALTISTGTTNWTTNPSTDSVYWVLPSMTELFHPEYFLLWVRTYGKNFTIGDIWRTWVELIDANGNLRAGKVEAGKSTYQIQETITDVLEIGKHIYDYTIL
jgi:hypothetical protein